MNRFAHFLYLLVHPRKLADSIMLRFPGMLSDKQYIECMWRTKISYKLNLKKPQTFNEKLQWLKLYDHNPLYTTMVDKYAVKDYVANIIGNEYIIPTYGVWDRAEDIDWDKLPDQFVLKCTHDSGGLVICRDKSKLNRQTVVAKLNNCLKTDYYSLGREWPYKNVPHRIIAEQYMEPTPDLKDLPDYKWYCFDGEPKYCQVIQNRSTKETIDFFDIEWNHQPFIGMNPDAIHAEVIPQRPVNLEEQIRIAKELSKDMPFSRIDLYETGKNTYFGEITLYPTSGFGYFKPNQYNEILGEMLKLPGQRVGRAEIRIVGGKIQVTAPDLPDYKFFCFNGKVKALFIATGRQIREEPYFDFFDADFNYIEMRHGHPNAPVRPQKPHSFELMKQLAEKISAGLTEARVDFYEIDGIPKFGEITLFHHGGWMPFDPIEKDYEFGQWIELPQKN